MRHPLRLTCLLAPLLAGSLAGCGGSQNASDTAVVPVAPPSATRTVTTPTQTTAAATAATTATTTQSTTTSATSSSPSASGPPCRASDLSLAYLGGQGATGHGELGFALRNTGTGPCHTYGFPGITFLDASGNALQTLSTRSTNDFFGSVPERLVVLSAGQTASFRVGVSHVSSGGGSACTTAAGIAVIPPDDTATLKVTIPGGAYECGTATVSPVAAGTSAYS
jgi:hypothetical protein